MSNNAYPALTAQGDYGEIGIAQAIQAVACRQVPRVEMNPILLKSGGQRPSDGAYLCSVFVNGKLLATEDYGALGERTQTLMDLVLDAHATLPADVVIMEGAGSCTELNLMHRDVVNIPLVRRLKCPWILVANIDPGGVFAQIVGTKACLTAEDWDLCVGVIVNKLRGDLKYFYPGPQILQDLVGKPIFVIPYLENINIAEEDGMGLERKLITEHAIDETNTTKTRIVVVCPPHISMTDDLLPLEQDERFQIEWRRNCLPQHAPAAIILPGSRQTRADMQWLAEQSPWMEYLQKFAAQHGKMLGLCGGYQMLGEEIVDMHGIESGKPGPTQGLGILPLRSTLGHAKVVQGSRTAVVIAQEEITVEGFEIHSGETSVVKNATESDLGSPLFRRQDWSTDGWIKDAVAGTYLHGVLGSRAFRSWFFLGIPVSKQDNQQELTADPLDRLADHLIAHGLDYNTLSDMIGLDGDL